MADRGLESELDDKLACILDAAEAHGAEVDPEHEVGDLRLVLEACWRHLTESQRRLVHAEVYEFLGEWKP